MTGGGPPRRRMPRSRWSDRPVNRSVRLFSGLVLFGLGLALLVHAHLGLDPWTVFTQGLTRRTGLSLGTITVLISLSLLLVWIPLRERPGLGTIANALVVGPVLDLGVAFIPNPTSLPVQIVFLVLAVPLIAVATGLYVGAGWGPGPRDGLMTGLAALGLPLFAARMLIEGTVLVIGWLLGGTVGLATLVFALTIGPLVGRALTWLALPPTPTPA